MAILQDQRELRWDDVRLFLAIHRQPSLGQAGVQLGVDTSTVSRRLAALEAGLGVRLFDRSREGLTPTATANLVLAAAEAMEAAHGRFARDASGRDTPAEGVVRLAVAPGFADTFIAPALVRLRARHPRITVEIDATARVVNLMRHEADLALRSVRPQGAELVTTKLHSARWIAAAARKFLLGTKPVASWDMLPWIAWEPELGSFAPMLWLNRHVPKADIVLRTSHFASQIAAAVAGLGVLLLPEPYVRARGLVPVPFRRALAASAAEWPTDHLWLVSHRSVRDAPRVAAVWNFFLEELRALA